MSLIAGPWILRLDAKISMIFEEGPGAVTQLQQDMARSTVAAARSGNTFHGFRGKRCGVLPAAQANRFLQFIIATRSRESARGLFEGFSASGIIVCLIA